MHFVLCCDISLNVSRRLGYRGCHWHDGIHCVVRELWYFIECWDFSLEPYSLIIADFLFVFFIPLSSWFDCCKLMTLSHRLINAIKKWLSNYHILIVTQSHRVGQWQLSRLLSVSCLTTTTTTTQSWVAADCMWVNLCDMHAAPYTLWTLVGIADHCVSWPVRLSVFVQVPCSECGRYRSCGRWYCHLSRVTAACSLLQFVLPQIFLLSLSAPYSTSWTVNGCE